MFSNFNVLISWAVLLHSLYGRQKGMYISMLHELMINDLRTNLHNGDDLNVFIMVTI